MTQNVQETAHSVLESTGAVIISVVQSVLDKSVYIAIVIAIIVIAFYTVKIMKSLWVQSEPNQWLLVIRNGQLYKSGVGLKCFIGFTDSYVKFPSKIQKVNFTANNVTKEMQGIIITGFAFWSVNRKQQGPFKCYKYMEGGDANSNMQTICESALRNLIANSTLDQVMRNRNHLRENMNKDLASQLAGWGIWLQSVQITEVKISSTRLFNDLQAQFRQETRLKAEKIQIESNQKTQSARQQSELKMAMQNQTNQTRKLKTKNDEELKRKQAQADFDDKKNELEIKRLEREKKFEIERLKSQLEKETEKLNNNQKLQDLKQEFQLAYQRKKLQLDRLHDDKTLQKYQIDVMAKIYERLPIKEIKINQFSGESKSSLSSLLPTLGFAKEQMETA